MILGVILAGGESRRFKNGDKGAALWQETPLAHHVYQRLSPQVNRVIISGRHDYALNIPHVNDIFDNAEGPLAGLISVFRWNQQQETPANTIITVPVDAPLLPLHLVKTLSQASGPAVLHDGQRLQPTFAQWPRSSAPLLEEAYFRDGIRSLMEWTMLCGASIIQYGDTEAFTNINTVDDLKNLNHHS